MYVRSRRQLALPSLTYIPDYLIIVFVGLFLVFLAAICLSAWCCRGRFRAFLVIEVDTTDIRYEQVLSRTRYAAHAMFARGVVVWVRCTDLCVISDTESSPYTACLECIGCGLCAEGIDNA